MSTSAFVPDAGTYFYAESTTVYERVVGGGMFGNDATATVVKTSDRSWSDDILLCTGRDDTAVIGSPVTGLFKSRPVLFKRNQFQFAPVGPEVLAALSLIPTEPGESA